MNPPYFIVQLKADLNFDDCVDFINSLTEQGQRRFRNLFVALPFTVLQKISKTFPDTGISFGAIQLVSCAEGSFGGPIASKMVVDVGGVFALIGTQDERKVYKVDNQELKNKLLNAAKSGLKSIFCIRGVEEADLTDQLKILKESETLFKDEHPIVVFEVPFTEFKGYFPEEDELKKWFELIRKCVKEVFGDDSNRIGVVFALPSDLVGFTAAIESMPFEGAFFTKSGVHHHAVHQEAVQLFHVHATEGIESPLKRNPPPAIEKVEETKAPPVRKPRAKAAEEAPKVRKPRVKKENPEG